VPPGRPRTLRRRRTGGWCRGGRRLGLCGPGAAAKVSDAAGLRIAQRRWWWQCWRAWLKSTPGGLQRLVVIDPVGLHHGTTFSRLDGIGRRQLSDLGEIDGDAHALLGYATDDAVLVIDERRISRLP
jgi:hypothetical protein